MKIEKLLTKYDPPSVKKYLKIVSSNYICDFVITTREIIFKK